MVARKAHDFMVKTLTGKGYLPWMGRARGRADEAKPSEFSDETSLERKHLLQSVQKGRAIFPFPRRMICR